MEVIVSRKKFQEAISKWILDNPKDKHPMTNLLDNMGLSYLKLDTHGEYRCFVADSKKYMIARIKYGI
jgi:hypothetical protein